MIETATSESKIPDGKYKGIWCGFVVTFKGYEATTKIGVKGIMKCRVTVTNGEIKVSM